MLQLLSKVLSPNVPLTCCLAAAVVADGTFRSRPDLTPPHLNVTIGCSGRCENDFIFVAPFVGDADLSDHAPLQSGAEHIFLPIPATLFGPASHTSPPGQATSKLLAGKVRMFFLLLKECITVSIVMVMALKQPSIQIRLVLTEILGPEKEPLLVLWILAMSTLFDLREHQRLVNIRGP